MLLTLILISVAVFMLVRLTGNPEDLLMSPLASEAERQVFRAVWGLDQPVYMQYLKYITGIFHGDFGTSIYWGEPTLSIFFERFPATLKLATFAITLSTTIGIAIGVLSATHPGGKIDHFGRIFALAGQSLPTFWVGIRLVLLFSVNLGVLPTSGTGVLTLFGVQFVNFISGSLVTETIFAWPGIGRLAVWAVYNRDYPVVQTILLLMTTAYLVVNLLVDVIYALIDPRIRYD